MCDIVEQILDERLVKVVRAVVKNFKVTEEQAMDALELSEEKKNRCKALLSKNVD